MKKSFFAVFILTSAIISAQSVWKSDNAHSGVNFAISHLLISEVTGNFTEFEIEATADDTFGNPSFTVSIPTKSINTGNTRRDDHLRSDDFFGAEKFPTLEFNTTGLEKTGEKTFKLTGDLTMHGVTKPVVLDGKVIGIITDQRSQKLKAGLKLTGSLSRKDFGIGGDMAPIGNEVEMTINLEMAQQ